MFYPLIVYKHLGYPKSWPCSLVENWPSVPPENGHCFWAAHVFAGLVPLNQDKCHRISLYLKLSIFNRRFVNWWRLPSGFISLMLESILSIFLCNTLGDKSFQTSINYLEFVRRVTRLHWAKYFENLKFDFGHGDRRLCISKFKGCWSRQDHSVFSKL